MRARMPEADVERARNVSILEVWERLGLPPAREGRAIHSPFRDDEHPSLQVGGEGNFVFDHATSERLDGIDLVRKVKNCDFAEAVDFVLGGNGMREGKSQGTPAQRQVNHERRAKPWPDLRTAEREFGKLPLAREDADALGMFARDYGLRAEWVPETWRVFSSNSSRAIVYPGRDPEGGFVAFKAKRLRRDAKGKRPCWFLYGRGGALCLYQRRPDAPLVVVSGEEKAVAAWGAGYHALSPLTGEKVLDDVWIRCLAETPRPTILCNDADIAGEKANAGTARVLEEAGFPPERLWIADWPKDAPEGYDLNDALKTGGPDAVRELLAAARPWPSRGPRALPLRDFLSADRPPLKYLIEGILPAQGKLTTSGPAKRFKSVLAEQTGLCLASGHCQWLGMRFNDPIRVLMIQPELSDALMVARTHWILDTLPDFIDRDRALQNFILMESAQGRPNLATDQGRARVESLIVKHEPRALICDPFYMLFPGLAENDADKMTLALDYLGGLTVRFALAIILTHHFNKSGTAARGSSVFQGWGDADLSMTPLENDPEICRVDALLRCSFGKGFPAYWRYPTEENAWFESMPEDFRPDPKMGRTKIAEKQLVAPVVETLKTSGKPLSWSELVAGVAEEIDCSDSTAKRRIGAAVDSGAVATDAGSYLLPSWKGQK